MTDTESTRTPHVRSARAELREQQARAAKKQRRRLQITIGTGLIAAVGLFCGALYLTQHVTPAGNTTPPHAVVNAFGVEGGTNPNKLADGIAVYPENAKPDAPVVQLYADYQCPGCKAFDNAFGEEMNKLAQTGEIKYSIQTETFLNRLGANKSTDPAIAASCADIVGAFPQYHLTVFKHQPKEEGKGYTFDELKTQFAHEADITGDKLTAFQQCYTTRATEHFVEQQNQYNTAWTSKNYEEKTKAGAADAAGWGSTPLLTVNNKRLDVAQLDASNPASIKDAIIALAKK